MKTQKQKLIDNATRFVDDSIIKSVEYEEVNHHLDDDTVLDTVVRIQVVVDDSVTGYSLSNVSESLSSVRPRTSETLQFQFDYKPEEIKEVEKRFDEDQ